MNYVSENNAFFSRICIEECKGICCDPWWGIISYTVVKEGGLSDLNKFKTELIKGIKIRGQRIKDAYATNETPSRSLFNLPERYNIKIRDIKINGNRLEIDLMAMYAFRCLFLSKEKICTIHPSLMNGLEIRPPHCGFMGSLDVKPNEKGYCRIIHSAKYSSNNESAINTAINIEKDASEKHYREGSQTVEKAAAAMIDNLKEYCRNHASHLFPLERTALPGRNEPCYCGSNKKYKKCHGK